MNEAWHAASLERIFIENKLYQLIEGCRSHEEAYAAVDKGLEPFKKLLRREVTLEDVLEELEGKSIAQGTAAAVLDSPDFQFRLQLFNNWLQEQESIQKIYRGEAEL